MCMVKIMENPIKIDDLGENPLFLETSVNPELCTSSTSSREVSTGLEAYQRRPVLIFFGILVVGAGPPKLSAETRVH